MDANEAVQSVLTHHGVKGMRWGVTRDKSAAVTVTQKGKKLKATGGVGHKPSSDAITAKKIGQVKKKSGTHALTNEQLQAYQQRLNLEQNVKQLEIKQPGGKNWVKRLLVKQGDQQAQSAASSAASKIGKAALAAA